MPSREFSALITLARGKLFPLNPAHLPLGQSTDSNVSRRVNTIRNLRTGDPEQAQASASSSQGQQRRIFGHPGCPRPRRRGAFAVRKRPDVTTTPAMTSFETQLVNARDTGREVKMRIDELGPDAEPAGPEELDVDVNDEVEVERMIDDPTRVPLPVAAVAVQDPSRGRIRTKRYRVRMVILNIDTGEESTLACARNIKLAFLQVGQNQTFPRLLTLTFLFPPPPLPPRASSLVNSTARSVATVSCTTGTPRKSAISPNAVSSTSHA